MLKPKKPSNVASSYRPVSLLYAPSKLYERLIYNPANCRIGLSKEQAVFRPGRSSQDQVVSLTENIECAFDMKLNADVVFVDLSAAYNTV